ncbi:MAG: ABC transporter permease, partial [Bacteroides sp.]|nr:ABC transporter permease [Bacteroides sp.]
LMGGQPNYTEVETVKTADGRFINRNDLKERRKVIVLHKKTAEVLFGKTHTEPIGKFVNASGVAYQVVGIYNDQGDRGNSEAYIPFSTLQSIYNKGEQLNSIIFTTKNLETIESNEQFESAYRKVIGANRRFDPQDNSAIWIWNRFTNYMRTQNAMGILRTAIWVIGIFTLLSGIVGVSNIMLITVKERTREFGIRKALGAKPLSILWLIIVESIAITTLFGYIGMVAGIAVTEWMNAAFGNQTMDAGMFQQTMFSDPTVDLGIAVQATLTLIVAGTLAGFFPARKAVSIRPIEALRAD